MQTLKKLRQTARDNDLFTFRGIIREKELDAFVNICYATEQKPDFNNITTDLVA